MTKQEAKDLGATSTKQYKDGRLEAVFTGVGDMARFASELRKRSISYSERFANNGNAIRFCWVGNDDGNR